MAKKKKVKGNIAVVSTEGGLKEIELDFPVFSVSFDELKDALSEKGVQTDGLTKDDVFVLLEKR